jgi:hypothetical protein
MRHWWSWLALGLLCSGCSSGGGAILREAFPASGLGNYRTVFVDVSTTVPDYWDAVTPLRSAILQKLAERACFSTFVSGDRPENADLKLSAAVTRYSVPSEADRAMMGAFATKTVVQADIKLVDLRTGRVVADFVVEGTPPGSSSFSGTTSLAIEAAGDSVADYIRTHK